MIRIAFTTRRVCHTMKNKHTTSQGFTLVEVLIVLTIILILAAILFPVFNRVRQNTKRASCQSNQKQLFLALHMYVQDSDSKYPPFTNWDSKLGPYVKNMDIFECPSADPAGTKAEKQYGLELESVDLASVKDSTHTIVLIDSTAIGFTRLIFLSTPCVEPVSGDRLYGFSGRTIHSGGGNYLYADGHVKWMTVEGAIQWECGADSHG